MAKNNYEALNAKLLHELPKLYGLTMEVLRDCLGRLVWAQKQYLSVALEEMYQLLGVCMMLHQGTVSHS